jgi:hypothetical protein
MGNGGWEGDGIYLQVAVDRGATPCQLGGRVEIRGRDAGGTHPGVCLAEWRVMGDAISSNTCLPVHIPYNYTACCVAAEDSFMGFLSITPDQARVSLT